MRAIDLGLIGFDFATEILCWYLWGQSEAPKPTELRSSKWIDRQEPITLKIDPNEFFSLVGRDTFNAKDIKLFKTFFIGKTIGRNVLNSGKALNETQYDEYKDGKYYLTQEQFADLFYSEHKGKLEFNEDGTPKPNSYDIAKNPYGNNAASISLYDRNILKPNFAKIAFAFGSVKLGLDTSNIRYVLDENLNPLAVENVAYKLDLGDFDFEGGEGSEEVNKILRQIADPSGIGKKVDLKFSKEAKIYAGNITKEDYASLKDWKDLKTKLGVDNPPAPIDNELSVKMVKYAKFLDEFNRIKEVSKAIDYLDENGKIVMFRGNEKDKMMGTQAANFNYSDNVETEFKGHKIPFKGGLLNHFKDHIKNGITYVGGAGDDTIIGTDYDDILYGHDKEGKDDDGATDTLVGGKGSDKLYGGKGDDTLMGSFRLSDDGDMDELYGGDGFDTYYVGDKDIIFDSDGKGKIVFDGVELKGGTYDKDKGAYVSKDGLIEYRLNESGGKSTLTVQKGGKSITINEFGKEDKSLGITLLDANEIGISISDNQTNEGDSGKKSLDFNISLQGSIEKGEFLILGVGDKEYLFGDPSEEYIKKYNLNLAKYERGNIYTYTWDGNTIKQEDREFEITPRIIQTSDKLKVKILKSGTGKIIDDDDDPGTPNDTFPDTTPASIKTSPIVIDLNGDGVKTISRKNGKTYFDLDNNKFAENTSWIDKNDGILINKTLIANSVTNGSELFGNHTLLRDGSLANNGFEALKEFDENKDGVINELDALAYENLAIWQDTNQNAKLDDNELKSLKELGIKEINLNYTNSSFIDENGNEHRQTSNVVFENGNKATISDVWLDTHTADTKYIGEKIILSNEIKALPEVTAFGNLHNLRNAMSKNSGLENMIKDYMGLSLEEKAKQLDNVLFKWAGVEGNACIKASPNRHYG